ncbi:alpha/beta hydrolase family protein [Aurantiacibacter sp. MUD61]|uniref:alpha/beta hydrolase family protein n=1 Tax=Aurantiacibacter sp. MUD61 TaxID=3009083 RepID=UPI0022F0D5F1|nr:alpha/beta hydrolase [Aurantiacibacter sp. MUD61]
MRLALSRRMFMAAALAAPLALHLPVEASTGGQGSQVIELPLGDDRAVPLTIWEPEAAQGVALFSHGYNSWPTAYDALAQRLSSLGYVVLAPLHPDSLRSEQAGQISPQDSFRARLENMAATSAFAATQFPDLPVIAAGHSFGSLDAMLLGGASAGGARLRDTRVTAVLGFSSPGLVPGLIDASSFVGIDVPMLLISGTQDTVPGLVDDAEQHLVPVQQSGTAAWGLVLEGASHDFAADDAMLGRAWPVVSAFLGSQGQPDPSAGLVGISLAAGDRMILSEGAER